MAQTQLSTFNGDQTIFDAKPSVNVSRSKFDLSRKCMFTGDIGMIMPIDLIPCVPGDDFKISLQHIIDTFPLVVPPMTRYRVRTHWYYSDCNSLWKGWQTFITKGRSGNISLQVPHVNLSDVTVNDSNSQSKEYSLTKGVKARLDGPMSLSSFFGLSPSVYQGSSPSSVPGADLFGNYLPYVYTSGSVGSDYYNTGFSHLSDVNVLPFMMYQKIFRYNYLANNLLQNSKVWFPDDLQDEWRISYSADNLANSTVDSVTTHYPIFTPSASSMPAQSSRFANFIPISDSADSHFDNCVNLLQLRYSLYDNDFFTSARPWLVRGSDIGLSTKVDFSDVSVFLTPPDVVASGYAERPHSDNVYHYTRNFSFTDPKTGSTVSSPSLASMWNDPGTSQFYYSDWVNILPLLKSTYVNMQNATAPATVQFSANTLRSMLALSVWQERNSVTNGNYNEYVKVHFDTNPKKPDYEPVYIGGTSDLIQFADIIQTSASTSDSPLGTQGGLGHSQASGYVGSFHCSDYGYIMGVMIITPESTYVQGAEHWQFDLNQEDYYCPEFANLSYQAILNKQVYVSGNSVTDNDLFGYSNRYVYMKTRESVVRGLFSLSSTADLIFSAYAQSRIFTDTPKLSYQFCVMSPYNTRRDWLMYPAQPAFKIQLGLDVQAVRPLPYLSQPETFGF